MAHYRAVAAVCAAIRGLLKETYPRAEFGTKLEIDTVQAKDVANLGKEGIAILLWGVTINTQRRSLPPRTDLLGRTFKSSLPIDLSVMLLPYAETAERQHRLLGWAMRALADSSGLAAGQLNNYLAETDVFADIECVDLVCDPLGVADYLALWSRIEKAPLSVNYLVRMVMLDSQLELTSGAPVIERSFEVGSYAP